MDYNKNQNKNQSTDNKPSEKRNVEIADRQPERVIKHSLDRTGPIKVKPPKEEK